MSGAAQVKGPSDDRYRVLLDASSAIAEQPTVEAILRILRTLLSKVAVFHGADLYLLSDDQKEIQLVAFDRASDAPHVPKGIRLSVGPALGPLLTEHRPVYIPDLAQEMLRYPELAVFASQVGERSAYAFPITTSRKQYGLVMFVKMERGESSSEEIEMMSSVASQVSVALETALSTDRAERYQRELARERDRLRLLLEINNHVVSHLDMEGVFHAASASIRTYFRNHSTDLWLIDRNSNRLQSVLHDLPGTAGSIEPIGAKDLTDQDYEKLRERRPEIWSESDIARLPDSLTARMNAEGIKSLAVTPLVTANGPLGLLAMGSKNADAFRQEDLDLLSQIGMQIALALDNALAYGRLRASHADLEEQRLYLESEIRSEYSFEDIVGKSAALRKVLEQIAIVAPTSSTVLLHGETGTGKELIARALHNLSPRRDRTFVRLNCAAIPSGLVESELFGHEKGAFTGALMQKRGRFELAHNGTLFLDEIGDISLDLQPKLLRALQEREFERLGSTKTIHVDVRLIAATHRDLPSMIRAGQFREDLFYRLNVFPIEVPPLRDRREDIPLLIHHFVSRISRRMQKRIRSIPKHAMDALVNADWPGNVRELENFLERCVILTQGDELHVPRAELKALPTRPTAAAATLEEAERRVIIDALKASSGKIAGSSGAAQRLGLKRTTLQNKMRKLRIARADYQS